MKIKAQLEPGKVAIVTGGSSGIGKAIACQLAERGMHVWLLAQRKELLETARAEVITYRKNPEQKIATISLDVSQLNEVHSAVQQIQAVTGPVDLLINSAGVTHPGYVEKLDINIFTWMMEVNYFGTVYVTKEVLPAMIKRKSGFILNISSGSGIVASFGYTAYAPSKFAVYGFSEALRQEMKVRGIGVSVLFPNDTDTPQLAYENQYKPPETFALNGAVGKNTAEEVARSAIRGIARGQYLIFSNLEGKLTFLLKRYAPGLLDLIMDQILASVWRKRNITIQKEA
jgi:3-dehydrosphinganine reductase